MKWPNMLKMSVIHSIRRERRSLVKRIWGDLQSGSLQTRSVVVYELLKDLHAKGRELGIAERDDS